MNEKTSKGSSRPAPVINDRMISELSTVPGSSGDLQGDKHIMIINLYVLYYASLVNKSKQKIRDVNHSMFVGVDITYVLI